MPSLSGWSNEHLEEFLSHSIEQLGIPFHTKPTRTMDLANGVKQPRSASRRKIEHRGELLRRRCE